MRRTTAAIVAILMLAGGAPAHSQGRGDPETGRMLAEQWCSTCHITGVTETRATDVARGFEAIAEDPERSEDWLRAWLAAPHPPMPDLNLTRREIDHIVAYLKSLEGE
jgi:mono/diheme cytochrome c family protein